METLPGHWPNRTEHLLSFYRERTSQFTRWAIHNARARGCPEDILTSTPDPALPLVMKNFQRLAQWISDCDNPPIIIPLIQMAALNSAIQSRREYSAILIEKKNRVGKAAKSDQTHEYFVELLEKVLETLLPCLEPEPTVEPNHPHREELLTLFAKWRPQESVGIADAE